MAFVITKKYSQGSKMDFKTVLCKPVTLYCPAAFKLLKANIERRKMCAIVFCQL
jgi:hypothetical protein